MSCGGAIRRAADIKTPGRAERLLDAVQSRSCGKGERYYQQIAINRTVEAILQGRAAPAAHDGDRHGQDRRGLPDLLEAVVGRWNRTGEYRTPAHPVSRRPQILVDEPKDGIFAAFGDARHKIEGGEIVKSREMYFAIYQALAEDERRAGLFRRLSAGLFRPHHRR